MFELDNDAERIAFEKHFGPKNNFSWRNEDGTYKIYALQSAWEIWQAARRADPAAPMGQELPPLPSSLDTVRVYLRAEVEFLTPGDEYFTDDQMRDYAGQAIAPYAERIRHLERELDQARGAYQGCARSLEIANKAEAAFLESGTRAVSIDTPEFRALVGKVAYGNHHEAIPALIAYIDGRPAGTAPEGWKMVPVEPTMDMAKVGAQHAGGSADDDEPIKFHEALGRALSVWNDMIAAAPTPTNSGSEEAK
jgi:hypothetical protein